MGGKILIVDDDPDSLRLVSYALQAEGYEIVTADSGSDALAAVEKESPRLVILDVMMPDMSGVEVCQRLRSNSPTSYLPILMLSAKGKVTDRVTGLRAGADDYVPKPVDPTELVARVEALLSRAARSVSPALGGHMVAFLGAKGGVGTTTVAVNVALVLVQQGQTVILLDLHPYLGTVGLMLGLGPSHGLAELAQMEARGISSHDVESRLVSHFSGLRVLANDQARRSEEQTELTPAHVEVILDSLRTLADWVIFDLPMYLSAVDQAVLARCDFVTLVTEPDPMGLWCAKGYLALLQQGGIVGEVGVVIVNRSPSTMAGTITELQDRLGAPVVGVMPPAAQASVHALQKGTPLSLTQPEHLASEMLRQLAQRLLGKPRAASSD